MKSMLTAVLIMVAGLYLSGCATIVTGPYQKVQVTSEPSGAEVKVDDKESYQTPAKIRLKRNRDHVLVFMKEGYREQTVKLLHVLSGAVCGNAVLGGLAGLAADNLSGAQFKLIPVRVHVNMEKTSSGEAASGLGR